MIKIKTIEPPSKLALAASAKKALLKDIGAKWRKFSETELSMFTTKDQIVTQVAALYEMDKPKALLEVDAVFKGRRL